MSITRFLFFSGKNRNIRPVIVFSFTLILTALLVVSVLEIFILIFGALGVAPPLWAMDCLLKLKILALKLVHHAK
jgi:hypothetical protein